MATILHAFCLLFTNPKCIQNQRLFPCVMVLSVEMGHVSMELTVMEWYSVLMAAMKSDVNDNHTAVTVLLPNFDAPLPTPIATPIPGASHLVVDVMEDQTAQTEAMNEIVGHIVTTAEDLVIAPPASVLGDVMVEPNAMMEVMSKIVGPIVTTAEDPAIAPLSPVQSDVMEDQSAMMEVMNKTATHYQVLIVYY